MACAIEVQRAGFRPGPVRMVRHSKWLRASAELACRTAEKPGWRRWLRHKTTSRLATWYTWLAREADCILLTAER